MISRPMMPALRKSTICSDSRQPIVLAPSDTKLKGTHTAPRHVDVDVGLVTHRALGQLQQRV